MNVPVGLGTIVGYALTAIGVAVTAILAVEGGTHVLSPNTVAVLTTVAGVATTLGRMLQASTKTVVPEVFSGGKETPPASSPAAVADGDGHA